MRYVSRRVRDWEGGVIYTVQTWGTSGDRGYSTEYPSKRAAMRAAAADARQLGATRVAPYGDDEIARWRVLNTGGGVIVSPGYAGV